MSWRTPSMDSDIFRFGFRVTGSTRAPRRLGDWRLAFRAYSECADSLNLMEEAYLSAFSFGKEFESYFLQSRGTSGYAGPTFGSYIWFDFDDETTPEKALRDARRVANWVVNESHCEKVVVYFSGLKGFHVGVPTTALSASPRTDFHACARRFAQMVATESGALETMDDKIYDRVRLFRAPNSRHPASGLHKLRLDTDMLDMSITDIRAQAEKPRPVSLDLGAPVAPVLSELWKESIFYLEKREHLDVAHHCHSERTTEAKMNPSSIQFLRFGCSEGERAVRLWQCAANLTECGAPRRLVEQILSPVALDTGLPRWEVERQIAEGIKHGVQ